MNSVIEKARYGRYEDTPENRRLHRVGLEYGHAAAQQEASPNQPKKEENPLERDAAALERKIADIKKNKRIWLEYEDGESRFNKVTTQLQKKLDGIREQLKNGASEKKEETVKETATVKEEETTRNEEKPVKEEAKETAEVTETKQDTGGEQQEEFSYRIKFDDMPNSGQVKFKKYLSNKIRKRIDESFKNLQGLDDKTIQLLHDGIVKDFNENFDNMKKSERAEALYKAMKVKNELEKRNKTDKSESLSDSDKQLRDEIETGKVVPIRNKSSQGFVSKRGDVYKMSLAGAQGEISFTYDSIKELMDTLVRHGYNKKMDNSKTESNDKPLEKRGKSNIHPDDFSESTLKIYNEVIKGDRALSDLVEVLVENDFPKADVGKFLKERFTPELANVMIKMYDLKTTKNK